MEHAHLGQRADRSLAAGHPLRLPSAGSGPVTKNCITTISIDLVVILCYDNLSTVDRPTLTHLRALEAESIFILREVVAEFQRPVMLYSIGKDSSVMVRLAQKAFYPG